ncbi:hypothetical protein KR044_007204 [Drosophila immigrans]|nr:hypothetical protein KR044_007204 [Drosophila immigrans]
MPRAKVQKKQVASDLPATNGNDAASSTSTTAGSDAADAAGQPTKGKVRGKKVAAAAAASPEDVNDALKVEAVGAKKITSRGKRKATEEREIEVKPLIDDLIATNGNKAPSSSTSSVTVKSKGRSKKTTAAKANDILEEEVAVEVAGVKKSAGRGKAKLPEEPIILGDSAPPTGRGRTKKPATVEAEEEKVKPTKNRAKKEITPVPVEPTVSKGKGRGKKTETVTRKEDTESVINDMTPIATVDPTVSKVKRRGKKVETKTQEEVIETVSKDLEPKARGRNKKEPEENVANDVIAATGRDKKEVKATALKGKAKKSDTETSSSPGTETAPATTKRSKGNKRLADTEISEMLEEDEEPELEAPPQSDIEIKSVGKDSVKRKKPNVENAEMPAKKRGKKAVSEDSADQPQDKDKEVSALTTKKRAPKRAPSDDQNHDPSSAASKPTRGRKRTAADTENNGDALGVSEADGSTSTLVDPGCRLAVLKSLQNVINFCFPASKTKKQAAKKTDSGSYDKTHFPSPTDKEFNLKVCSWNVAGLRAWLKKDGLKFVDIEEPDILCLQETKCVTDQLPEEVARLSGYHPYWLCMPGGYAGVAIYSKIMPINVEYGIGNEEFDDVGRMITAEYEKFYLLNVYVPNSGRKLVNLEPRMRWEKLFQAYVQKLDALKPVVICGDMNVSHLEIDLANPKSNTRNAGFTKEEREKMTELLGLGFVDTFRHLYPKQTGAYSFWTYMANARARNVGWRLDYCIVSERFLPRIVDNVMRSHCLGSDHCPITVFLNI